MIGLFRIALRNILADRRRSLLVGLSIFFSVFILMATSAVYNGVENQILKSYRFLHSGDVVVIWNSAFEIPASDWSRLFMSEPDTDRGEQNRHSVNVLLSRLTDHKEQVDGAFYSIRRFADIVMPGISERVKVVSISNEAMQFLKKESALRVIEGRYDASPTEALMNAETAEELKLGIGDVVNVEAVTAYGAHNVLEFEITGLYGSGAQWDNVNLYISPTAANELFDYEEGMFDIARIHLKNPRRVSAFAAELDSALVAENCLLRAVPFSRACTFYMNIAGMQKSFFSGFVVFIMVVIAVGISASVRMNLFERIREFGTLRSIGYSRWQLFWLVFWEIGVIALSCVVVSLGLTGTIVVLFSESGIHIDAEAAAMVFGGDRIYPQLRLFDVILSVFSVMLLSLTATMLPAMNIGYQSITDLLLKRQQPINIPLRVIQGLFNKAS